MLIQDIYNRDPEVIKQNVKVVDALKELIHDHVNGLIVLDESDHLVGILSLQDIAAATVPRQFHNNIAMASAMYRKGFFSKRCQEIMNEPVSAVMRTSFVTVTLEENIMAVTADFLKNDLYIVPVINEDDELIGVVTRTEIKAALAYGMGLRKSRSANVQHENKNQSKKTHIVQEEDKL